MDRQDWKLPGISTLEAFYESLDGMEIHWEPGRKAEVIDQRLGRMVLTRDGFTVNGSSPYDYPAGNADSAAHLGIEER